MHPRPGLSPARGVGFGVRGKLTIDEMIARLEAATEGSDELDATLIACLVGGAAAQSPINGRWCVYKGEHRDGSPAAWQPREPTMIELFRAHIDGRGPTRSIDAALTFKPERWSWRAGNLPSGKGFADLGTQQSLQCIVGATPALALCIAALKARAVVAAYKKTVRS